MTKISWQIIHELALICGWSEDYAKEMLVREIAKMLVEQSRKDEK